MANLQRILLVMLIYDEGIYTKFSNYKLKFLQSDIDEDFFFVKKILL